MYDEELFDNLLQGAQRLGFKSIVRIRGNTVDYYRAVLLCISFFKFRQLGIETMYIRKPGEGGALQLTYTFLKIKIVIIISSPPTHIKKSLRIIILHILHFNINPNQASIVFIFQFCNIIQHLSSTGISLGIID